MAKYPIGIQTFSELRRGNYLYVDKTEIIYQLFESGKAYFLSRPRRFGKSLLLNTIKFICKGEQPLFEGLWIYDKIEWQSRPIIHISFTDVGIHTYGLEKGIYGPLKEIATDY
jgi:Predicted AAA-ATPase